jgi:signal transduction histidine kinase
MISIRNLSIKNKLIWIQVLTSVLVLGLCFFAFVATDIRGYKHRKVNSMISIAQTIGNSSISSIQFLDDDAAIKILSNLQQIEPDVINASILDKNGKTFADYIKPGNPDYIFKPPYTDKYYHFDDDFLYIYKSIVRDNEFYGTVCLQIKLSELVQIKKQMLAITMILLITGIGLSFLIAYINQRYISKPLLSLVNVMKGIRESGNYHTSVTVTGKDEIATLSAEFNNLMQQIINSNQRKDEFIGIASHELKTPLTVIKGFLELLDESESEQPKKMFVEKALAGTQKLHDLVLDLLDVSKIQAGQLQLSFTEFNIDELIDECINNIQMSTRHHIIRQGERPDQLISADRNRIEQVIVNLLSNAIKYSHDETGIIVNTKKADKKITVSVQDFGVGIPESEHEKIFERFYRTPGKNIGVSGFGLGLYICAQIIRRHHGKIWVESSGDDNGSTFYFELPLNT